MPRTPDLTDLLARWHETAPDECEPCAYDCWHLPVQSEPEGVYLYPDRITGNTLVLGSYSLVLGAVVYHAARRGGESFHNVKDYGEGQKQVVFLIQNPASLKKASVGTIAYPRHDGAAALRALSMSALSAYLDAIPHA